MKLTRLSGLLAAALTVGSLSAAFAAGSFGNLPIVGGAAYCALYAGDGTTCVGNVPAGPSAITGNEGIPADTSLASGSSPQTVKLSMASINALPYSLQTGVAQTYTVPNNVGTVVLSHTTTITSAAITAPAAPVDGQTVTIAADHTVTTFSFVANTGQTLAVTTPTVLTASTTVPQGYKFLYAASTAKWYRVY